jgi:Tfp pilus assembly protein PilO
MIVTILAVAGVVAYVMLVFLPTQKAITAKRREVREKRQFIANANLQSANIAQLEQQFESARFHVEAWRKHSRLESGTVALLGELASLAGQSGVILHRLTPQDPTTMETLRQQTIEMEVEGSYSQIMSFLRGVESRPETIWFPHLELQPIKEDAANVQCALSVVVFADNRGNSG